MRLTDLWGKDIPGREKRYSQCHKEQMVPMFEEEQETKVNGME